MHMSNIQRLFSPDRRFFVLLDSYEMRMSHWVTSAALWEAASQRVILELGAGLWSAEHVLWSADSTGVTVELRRYPGDAPAIQLDVYPEQRSITPHAPGDAAPLRFEQLEEYLESYYQRHRRATPEDE
jgi:hypothetical protein